MEALYNLLLNAAAGLNNPAAGWLSFIALLIGIGTGVYFQSRRAQRDLKVQARQDDIDAVKSVSELVQNQINAFKNDMQTLRTENAQLKRRIDEVEEKNAKLEAETLSLKETFTIELHEIAAEGREWRRGCTLLLRQIFNAKLSPVWVPSEELLAGRLASDATVTPAPFFTTRRSPLGAIMDGGSNDEEK